MKKILTLSVLLSLATSVCFAADTRFSIKQAIKNDIQQTKTNAKNYNKAVKDSIKKDIEAKKQEASNASKKAKQDKIKEINNKIKSTNKEIEKIEKSTEMTYTEKTIKTRALKKQLEYLNKQKDSLK